LNFKVPIGIWLDRALAGHLSEIFLIAKSKRLEEIWINLKELNLDIVKKFTRRTMTSSTDCTTDEKIHHLEIAIFWRETCLHAIVRGKRLIEGKLGTYLRWSGGREIVKSICWSWRAESLGWGKTDRVWTTWRAVIKADPINTNRK
jgi:hypothetical protein